VLDVPHVWTGWARNALVRADEVVVVASPDLANLRNAKNLIDTLSAARPHDPRPRLVINQVGIPKRPEISVTEFAKALDVTPLATIAFDANLFGTANNNGQMIAETDAKHAIGETFRSLGQVLTGRAEIKKVKKSPFGPLLAKLRAGKSG
jgi:pilus assembly protein CpaE